MPSALVKRNTTNSLGQDTVVKSNIYDFCFTFTGIFSHKIVSFIDFNWLVYETSYIMVDSFPFSNRSLDERIKKTFHFKRGLSHF
jgi:hypothetical protein